MNKKLFTIVCGVLLAAFGLDSCDTPTGQGAAAGAGAGALIGGLASGGPRGALIGAAAGAATGALIATRSRKIGLANTVRHRREVIRSRPVPVDRECIAVLTPDAFMICAGFRRVD